MDFKTYIFLDGNIINTPYIITPLNYKSIGNIPKVNDIDIKLMKDSTRQSRLIEKEIKLIRAKLEKAESALTLIRKNKFYNR